MKKRVHVFYSGNVQGIGFRHTTEELAHQMGVLGWIKNLRDGRVELMAEAEEDILHRFLEAVRGGPFRNLIKQIDVSWVDSTNGFDDFDIRYS